VGIGQQMVFAPQLAPIRGIWAGFFASARSPQRSAVHESAVPIDLVFGLEVREQEFKKALPNSGSLPSAQVAQAGESRGKRTGSRKTTPGDARSQDEKDSSNDPTKVGGFSPGELNMTILSWFGKQRLQAFPKVVRQDCRSHDEVLLMRTSSSAS